MSIKFKAAGAIAATLMMAGTASAGCNSGSYCTSSASTSYSTSDLSYATSYPTGSISNEYSGGDVELFGFSGDLPGLGVNESLRATNCPVNVYNPEGAKVLGCYNVVKPVPQTVTRTTYYQVVRPVIYVRYPVPVGVPIYNQGYHYGYNYHRSSNYHRTSSASHYGSGRCGSAWSSRYGSANYGGGWGCR